MSLALDIASFLARATTATVIDVRTPAEFENGHIPGAVNVPLFTNEERAVVGTIYKKEGSQPAIRKGLNFAGPKLGFITQEIQSHAKNNEILIHCWRGGMRSSSVAGLMELAGIKSYTLKGGYKSFRAAMRSTFERPWNLMVIGGCTGSGKSRVLHEIEKRGETIIDLEALARHKGSSYGHLGEKETETQECFENRLGWILYHTSPEKTIWVEDESRMIGKKNIPTTFYACMREAPVFVLEIPAEVRAVYLTKEYGKFSRQDLIDATLRIEKRMGPEQCKKAVAYLREGNLLEACKISLVYYDNAYKHGLSKRKPESITIIPHNTIDYTTLAEMVLQQSKQKLHAAY